MFITNNKLYKNLMSKPLTKKSTDHSDTRQFSFSFFCDCCGKEWTSFEKPFSQGGFSVVESEEAIKLLWAHEHRTAFDEANLEAHLQFNRCPKCRNWFCDSCFNLEANVCVECNNKRK